MRWAHLVKEWISVPALGVTKMFVVMVLLPFAPLFWPLTWKGSYCTPLSSRQDQCNQCSLFFDIIKETLYNCLLEIRNQPYTFQNQRKNILVPKWDLTTVTSGKNGKGIQKVRKRNAESVCSGSEATWVQAQINLICLSSREYREGNETWWEMGQANLFKSSDHIGR